MENTVFRERVTPNLPSYLIPVLAGLGFTAVFLPILGESSILVGACALFALLALQVLLSPVVVVTTDHLIVGRARIERKYLGKTEVLAGDAKRKALGVDLDARSFLRIQGSAPQLVRVQVLDEKDPVPYWIFSTRHGAEILEALA
jgi:hypothetical protein